ncbi:MAG: hypothetical protein WBW06_01505 [Xanthobacteraceae bacterium]|jgi:hypothetical protein
MKVAGRCEVRVAANKLPKVLNRLIKSPQVAPVVGLIATPR